jgi:uncharacterized protein
LKTSERLIIPFKGLIEGWHEFNFKLTDKFFQAIDYSEFDKGNLELKIGLERRISHLVLEIELKGDVNVMCDRCLDFFDMNVDFHSTLYVKFSGDEEDVDENLMVLSPEDFEVDITHYIYESICLSLPYQRFHPLNDKGKSTCNKEMLKKMRQYGGAKTVDSMDPRWEKLKNLK